MKRKKPAGWKYKKERQNYYKNKGYKDEPFDEGITETFTKTGVRRELQTVTSRIMRSGFQRHRWLSTEQMAGRI